MAANNEATLSGMPLELVGMIADRLPIEDIRNFRLTNRRLQDGSSSTFVNQSFKKVTVNLNPEDIQRLIEIAEDEYFGPKVQELDITPQLFHGSQMPGFESEKERYLAHIFDHDNKEPFKWLAIESVDRLQALINERIKSYNRMRDTKSAESLLVSAMAGLKNLSTIRYHHNGQNFRWEKIQKLWKQARAPGLSRKNDWAPVMARVYKKYGASAEHPIFFGWSFRPMEASPRDEELVLAAIYRSGIACSSMGFFCGGLPAEGETQAPSGEPNKALQKCLRNLEKLDLTVFGEGFNGIKPSAFPRFVEAVPETLKELRVSQGGTLSGCGVDNYLFSGFPNSAFLWIDSTYAKALVALRCRGLEKIDVCIPGSALGALASLIRRNKGTLKSISVSSLNRDDKVRDGSSDTARWSDLLKVCLEAKHLHEMVLAVSSLQLDAVPVFGDLVEKSKPRGIKLEFCPVSPERARLEELLGKWQALENSQGLD